jgi:hypothetical protein
MAGSAKYLRTKGTTTGLLRATRTEQVVVCRISESHIETDDKYGGTKITNEW